MGMKSGSHYPPVVSNSVNLTVSNSGLEPKSGVPLSGAHPSLISESSDRNRTVCGFCQSSKVSEATGPMLHYANGKLVVGGDASCSSDLIHVHRKCIEWTPQVYFVGETVKNLMELARAAKLKCSRCGLKGVALGCYAKSCRKSFHVPCAVEVVKTFWCSVQVIVHSNFQMKSLPFLPHQLKCILSSVFTLVMMSCDYLNCLFICLFIYLLLLF